MHDDDYVSIVVLNQTDDDPTRPVQVSPVHYVSVKSLREAVSSDQVSITKPKGVEEGSEIRMIWTCASASKASIVESIDETRVRLRPVDGARTQTIQLRRQRGKILLTPLVGIGDMVEPHQIVASVVEARTKLSPPVSVDEQYFVERLKSMSLGERYAAAKALRYKGFSNATHSTLRERMNDRDEDIYVQLEAAAALAAHGDESAWRYLESKAAAPSLEVPLETQLETIIVASEIQSTRSENLLISALKDPNRHEELRAGAAWALGQFESSNSATALIGTFNANPLEIRIEAAKALLKISSQQVPLLVDQLKRVDPPSRDGIAWVLARTKNVTPATLLADTDDANLRAWSSYVIGLEQNKFRPEDLEAICEKAPEVYFAASVLWQIVQSWINQIVEH